MIEGKPLAAGEAILRGPANADRYESDRNRLEPGDTERGDSEPAADTARADEAIAELVRQHSRLVYRIAYAVLRSHADAEDATQETFLRVLRYSSRLDAVEDRKTWLARIAWRVAVDRGRRRGRVREIPYDDPGNPAPEAVSSDVAGDDAVCAAQAGSALKKLMAALPGKLLQPLVLSAIEEMSPREVAATLGISEAAVRSRVFRARQILREKLQQQMGGRQK